MLRPKLCRFPKAHLAKANSQPNIEII
jgi:hypothetical protein